VDSWYLWFSSVFWVDPVLFGALFDVFWGLRWVSFGFPWSSCWKSVYCGFWRTSGRFRWAFGVELWLLVFLSFLGLILFLFGLFLTCFGVSVWF